MYIYMFIYQKKKYLAAFTNNKHIKLLTTTRRRIDDHGCIEKNCMCINILKIYL